MSGEGSDDGTPGDASPEAAARADSRVGVTRVADAAALAEEPATSWPVVDSEVVWENPYFDAGYDVVEGPDGDEQRWYWIDPADVVAVVAETPEGDVVVVEQYDGRLGESLLTCPGGGVEAGESFVDAGVRELREETGYVAGEAELLTVYRPAAWVRMDQAVVYATDLAAGPADRDEGEHLDVYAAPPDVAFDAVRSRSPAFGGGLAPLLVAREAGFV